MAAHKYWRIRILKDSGFSSGASFYLNVKEMGFYDATMTRLVPSNVSCNNYFSNDPAAFAFDANTSTLLSLDTGPIHYTNQGYAWVAAQFAAPVDPIFFKYFPDSNNCPLSFAIDYSDDNIVWNQSIAHTMAQVTTESIFPTGNRLAASAAGSFPMWRIRMTVDTGSASGGNHYQNFKAIRFIDGAGNVVSSLAAFSSPYNGGNGTPLNAFNGGNTGIYTNGLYTTPKTDCFIGMANATAFRPSKIQFIMNTGDGIQNSNASFVLEASTNGKTWFQEAEFINQPFVADTLMDFAVSGALNSDMTMKKISELPYTELTAAQAKDALVPLSGIGDEADTLYKVSLADLAAMLVNSGATGTDYHRAHRGWRIMFGSTLGTGNTFQAVGDLTFLDRAGNTIATTGGIPYSYNGNSDANFGAAKAFDGDAGTIASTSIPDGGYINPERNFGIGYIFAAGQDVGSVKIVPATGYVGDAPKQFAVQYSDDGGISWTSFASFDSVTDWATGVSKQFFLPSAGIATSGINYGKDFWRSQSFSTPSILFGEQTAIVFPSTQIISGAVPGRRLVVEALIRHTNSSTSTGFFVATTDNNSAYQVVMQSDHNMVLYAYKNGSKPAIGATGANASFDFTGYYHFQMIINIGDISSQFHGITALINNQPITIDGSNKASIINNAAINLAQDLKIAVIADSYDSIKWCHYRWDDNGLDVPVITTTTTTTGGSTGGTGGTGGTVVVGGSPTRYYRLGGFATVSPQANEVLVLNAVADPFVFGADFVGSYGKAGTPPLATYVCTVKQNGTAIGTMTVSTAGAVTFASTSHAAVLVAAGDVISVVAPSTPDAGITNLAFTLVGVTNVSAVYLGARVKLNATTADNVNNRIVAWDAEEHDAGNFWVVGTPDRFIIPAGVTKVRVQAGIQFVNANAGTTAFAAILKNSADPALVDATKIVAASKAYSAFDSASTTVDSGVLTVVPGDYFTICVNTTGDTTAGIGLNGSFFSIEAVDGSALLSGEPDILQPTPLLVTPTYRFGFFFEYAPDKDERLGIHVVTDAFTFAKDFAGSLGHIETPPAANYTMIVNQNNVQIGTVLISAAGGVTFSSTANGPTSVAVGDRLSLVAPTNKDTVIAGGAITFKGTFV